MSLLAFVLAKTAAEEGRDIVVSMLVVGLLIVAIIVLGDVNEWRHRRHRHRS